MSYVPPAQRAAQAQQARLQRMQGVDSAAICAALEACLSMNESDRKPAEQLLRDAEGTPGFCTLLLQIATSGEVSEQIRKLAMLAAKNALGRTWSQSRDPRAPSIAEDEKATLREAVVGAVCSPAVKGDMALQLALIAAKIARFDFPRRWPTLLPALAAGLQSSEEIVVFHSVRCLHYVLKERTTKQLMRDRLDFIDSVTPQILTPLAQMWSTHSAAAIAAATPQAMAGMTFVLSQFLDKCLLTLLCHGFRPGKISPEDAPAAVEILPALVEKTESLYAAVAAGSRAAAPSFHSLLKGLGRLQAAQPKALLLVPAGERRNAASRLPRVIDLLEPAAKPAVCARCLVQQVVRVRCSPLSSLWRCRSSRTAAPPRTARKHPLDAHRSRTQLLPRRCGWCTCRLQG